MYQGLFTGMKENRDQFQLALQDIAAKVTSNAGERPLIYILNLLRKNYPEPTRQYVNNYFELFVHCMNLFKTERETGTKFM